MSDTKMPELLPCPFCQDVLVERGDYSSEGGWNWMEHKNRDESDCILKDVTLDDWRDGYKTSRAKWNTRAQPPVLDEPKMEEQLEYDLKFVQGSLGCEMGNRKGLDDLMAAFDRISRALSAQRIASGNDGGDERAEAIKCLNELASVRMPLSSMDWTRICNTIHRALAAQPDTAKPRGGEPVAEEWFFRWAARAQGGHTADRNAISTIFHHPANPYAENNPWQTGTAPTDHQAQPDTGRLMECIRDLAAEAGITAAIENTKSVAITKHATIISAANEQAGK